MFAFNKVIHVLMEPIDKHTETYYWGWGIETLKNAVDIDTLCCLPDII